MTSIDPVLKIEYFRPYEIVQVSLPSTTASMLYFYLYFFKIDLGYYKQIQTETENTSDKK